MPSVAFFRRRVAADARAGLREAGTSCLLHAGAFCPGRQAPDESALAWVIDGGEGGIRTHVELTPPTDFESAPVWPLRYLSAGC